ncbi:uncharacterized protein LOC126667464 [Mercurialis annua]|uniref:uncharacterized protein LOC126667464 n=1 Tax=Mercurialis annua TaxID=3986 RepID=UPI00215EE7FB|nr:uncharacterized protein LOC126667464 [Mercurialis annua]
MGTLFLNQIKKQATFFLQEKYKNVRLALTDVSQAELLAEEATNSSAWGPDARTMTKIAEASYEVDDYWKIVDVLHKRFHNVDWKEWRQSYKSLILLEFLLTHGPEEFAEQFQSDSDAIEELGTFNYVDDKGFNWGDIMQKRSNNIINLLHGGVTLKEARLKALQITKEIQGFGSFPILSPSSSSTSSPSSATSESSRASSFGSFSTTSSTFNYDTLPREEALDNKYYEPNDLKDKNTVTSYASNKNFEKSHVWNCSTIRENGSLLDGEGDEKLDDGIINGIRTKILVGIGPSEKYNNEEKEVFRSLSNVGRLIKKKYDRQFSMD